MSAPPIRPRMQKHRTAPCTHVSNKSRSGCVDREHIVAVDAFIRQAECGGARYDSRAAGHAGGSRFVGIYVVFAHKQHRQVVNARPIERLEQRPAIERAITEKSDYDAV